MTITYTDAPDIPNPAYPKGGYPTKGKRLGPAWREMWREIQKASARDRPTDGKALSDKVADKNGLSGQTLLALLSRAANAGLLVKETRAVPVMVSRAPSKATPDAQQIQSSRYRTFYRIAPGK